MLSEAILDCLPSKIALRAEFVGKQIDQLRTPALVIDRSIFADNCATMRESVGNWGATLRAHVKTHKTSEGVRYQLEEASGSRAIVVSTMMEAWQILRSGLVKDGTVKDILYGLPIGVNKITELAMFKKQLHDYGAILRIFVDHPDQVDAVEAFNHAQSDPSPWSVFMKVDAGLKRSGLPPRSDEFRDLLRKISELKSKAIDIYGFYCHSGNAYASASLDQATAFLSIELDNVNEAARVAKEVFGMDDVHSSREPFVLSVGSTPTAHAAANSETRVKLKSTLLGQLEIHAGNYPMLDLQQLSTTLIDRTQISQKVVSSVLSCYANRQEAVCDAGAIAMSKDTGPITGFGEVVSENGLGWRLGRVSQEHGILVHSADAPALKPGDVIEIVGQHACLIAAAHPWYYIVDSSDESKGRIVKDVWVPWKGW